MASERNQSSPYQPTTEERLRASNEGLTCNPWGGRRHHGRQEYDLEEDNLEGTRGETERNPWVFTRCLSRSEHPESNSASTSQETIHTNPQSETADLGRRLSRAQTFKKKILKSTEDFFGLGESEEHAHEIQHKWTQRRHRHCSKRYGRPVDEIPQDVIDGTIAQTQKPMSSICSYKSIQEDPSLVRTLSRRQSVASMAWKGLRSRIRTGPGLRPEGPGTASQPSVLLERGRSFAPATMSLSEDKTDGAAKSLEEAVDGKDMEDEVFFDFISESATRPKQLPPPLPLKPKRRVPSPTPLPQIPEKEPEEKVLIKDDEVMPQDSRLDEEKTPLKEGKDEVEGPPAVPPRPSARGQRIGEKLPKARTNRREIGKGLVGRWLNRTIRRKRLSSTVKKQMETLSDHRPFFTYWISFVQVVVLIVSLSVYGLAPIGFTKTEITKEIDTSRAGTLVPEFVSLFLHDNFWIGPLQEHLILLGAKFAPCMRSDELLNKTLEEEKLVESESGCCIKSDGSGCIQTSREKCSNSFATFNQYSKGNKSRVVCGQDPQSCTDPASVKPYEWDKDDITSWPSCKKVNPVFINDPNYPHLGCEITGRPCCIGTEARCKIVSRDECEFRNGKYHINATLCSQVNCLEDTCGMLDFANRVYPDQVYRLWMALFNHAGIIHIACTLVFQFTILRDIERMAGWLRVSIIYIFSGIGGYLVSAILIPYQVEVGPSGSVFGIIACLFVELIQSWQLVRFPGRALLKLCGVVVLLLLLGLLPYVDNFAHMAGFVFGFLLAIIFLPYITFGKWDRRRKIIQILASLAILIILYVSLFLIFWTNSGGSCAVCEYLNCLPFTTDFCEPYNLGQKLQPRK